jgi:hypothetical protein
MPIKPGKKLVEASTIDIAMTGMIIFFLFIVPLQLSRFIITVYSTPLSVTVNDAPL